MTTENNASERAVTCPSSLRVWYPNGAATPYVKTVTQESEQHLRYACTRRGGHDGYHGWSQGFDRDWTYQWGDE